jgi:hypothetical protein
MVAVRLQTLDDAASAMSCSFISANRSSRRRRRRRRRGRRRRRRRRRRKWWWWAWLTLREGPSLTVEQKGAEVWSFSTELRLQQQPCVAACGAAC